MTDEVKLSTTPVEKSVENSGLWHTRARQTAVLISDELQQILASRRAILLYLLAALPVGIMLGLLIVPPQPSDELSTAELLGNANLLYANLYNGLIVRTVIFFGCAWLFMNLFRGALLDRSLHYWLLAPVRREVLLVAKYVAGVLAAWGIFSVTVVLSQVLYYVLLGPTLRTQYLITGSGFRHAGAYLAMALLACVGYGAAFVLIGLWFRNPIVPALAAYGWEGINFLLPPFLKKISVLHYLNSLAPVPISEGPFAIVADPTPIWLSILGLAVFAGLALSLAAWRVRGMEINYGSE